MRTILSFILSLFVTVSALAQTPPTKVPQSDGTIQLVPVPPAFVYTPYFIDPAIGYQLYLSSDWANRSWNDRNKNGRTAFKGEIITANILAMPIAPPPLTLTINGVQRQVYKWSIYRSSDIVVQYDHTRLELLPLDNNSSASPFDKNVMDVSKLKQTVLGDGLVLFQSEALKAPELRTPALKPQYYQWNFDGYMWQAAYRSLGKIQFRVKDDYYLPTWGSQRAFIRILPSTIHQGTTIMTKVDGSPTVGTNVLKETRSEGEQIMFGAPPEYKVSHMLTAQTTKYKVGDIVPVQIRIKPETKPQIISSVCTNFVWDNTKLEFMGISTVGAKSAQSSRMDMPGPGMINETSVPKDGNASHTWLSLLGDRSYLAQEALIVTLNFKVVSDFNTTQIEIVKQNDPRLVGLYVSDESSVIGSNIPGNFVLGAQIGVTINGTLP